MSIEEEDRNRFFGAVITGAALVATGGAAAFTGVAGGLSTFSAAGALAVAQVSAISLAAGYAYSALAGNTSLPDFRNQVRSYDINQLGSALPTAQVYGETKIGGAIFYQETTIENDYLHRMIAFADHEIESFEEVYLDEYKLTLADDGRVSGATDIAGNEIDIFTSDEYAVAYIAQIQEMVESKFWSRLEYQSYDFNTGDLVYNTTGAEYSNSSIRKAYKNQKISSKIVKKVEELYNRKSILIAVPSIDEAKELTTMIPSCKAVYSDMPPQERKETLEDFKAGRLRCIAQVNILSVGFDYPELDCIITGRPTASLSWWYQFVGRVTRIHPNKSEGLVVDFVGAVPKFGKVEDIYFKEEEGRWSMYGEGKKLLTGIPIKEIGLHIEGEPSPYEKAAASPSVKMPFGKYAGREVREIPAHYREWMLTNFNWTPFNQKIKDEILRLKSIGI